MLQGEVARDCVKWAGAAGRKIDLPALERLLEAHERVNDRGDPCLWHRGDLQELLDDYVEHPAPELADPTVEASEAWFDYLAEKARLAPGSDSPRVLRADLDGLRDLMRSAITSPKQHRVIQALTAEMYAEGVDIHDRAAVESWMDRIQEDPDRVLAAVTRHAGPRGDTTSMIADAMSLVVPVRLAPFAELARPARDCPPLALARRLAEWVGDGRPLAEDDDTLSGEDMALAARELGLEPSDVSRYFELARACGFLRLTYSEVLQAPALAHWPDGDDEAVVRVWSDGYRAQPYPDDPFADAGGLVVSNLYVGTGEDTLPAIESRLAELKDSDDQPLEEAIGPQEEYGVLERDGQTVRITPLGVYAMWRAGNKRGATVRVLPEPRGMPAAEMVAALQETRRMDRKDFAAAWLSEEGIEDGVRALLSEVTEPEAFEGRVAVFQAMRDLRPDAEPAWRDALVHGTLRAYAMDVLGEPLETPEDRAGRLWIFMDLCATEVALGRPERLPDHIGLLPDPLGFLERAWRHPHPAVRDILEAFGRHHPDKKMAKAARRSVFKLASGDG